MDTFCGQVLKVKGEEEERENRMTVAVVVFWPLYLLQPSVSIPFPFDVLGCRCTRSMEAPYGFPVCSFFFFFCIASIGWNFLHPQ